MSPIGTLIGLLLCALFLAAYLYVHYFVSLHIAHWASEALFSLRRLTRDVPRQRATIYAVLVWSTLLLTMYSISQPGSLYGIASTLVIHMACLIAISVAFLSKLRQVRALFARWEWKLAFVAVPAASIAVSKAFAVNMLSGMFDMSAANLPSTLTFATFFVAAKLASVPFMFMTVVLELLLLLILIVEDFMKKHLWRTMAHAALLSGLFFSTLACALAMNDLAGTHYSKLLVGQLIVDFDAVKPTYCQLSEDEKQRVAKKEVSLSAVYLNTSQESAYLLEAPFKGMPDMRLHSITEAHVKQYLPKVRRIVTCNKPS